MGKPKILVTGATGFLGRHLLTGLVQKSQPLALLRSREGWKNQDWTCDLESVELIEGSVTETNNWRNDPRLQGLRGIFHLAAVIRHSREDPEEMIHTNVEGLLQMVRLASEHHCRVIFISTTGTVGCFDNPESWADEESPYGEWEVRAWPYYQSKILAEKKGRALAEKLGVELVIVRPPVLLGPGDHRLRATGHIAKMLRGKLPFLIRGGIHFVDIRDATQALIRAMEIENPRPVYHLTGTACSIDEFFGRVEKVSGVPAPRRHLPLRLAQLISTAVNGLKPHLLPDPVVFEMASKFWNVRSRYAERDLGFRSRDPEETIADTVQWLRGNLPELKGKATSKILPQKAPFSLPTPQEKKVAGFRS